MLRLTRDFTDLLNEFIAGDVEFLIVGAHAMGAHGVVRATGDLDVWSRPTPDNARRAWDALRAFGAPVQAHGLTVEDLARPGTVYQMGLPPRRIDVLTEISGVSFEDAFSSRITREVAGRTLPFLGLEHLVANKRASGRTKDLLDVELLKEAGHEID